MSSVVAAREANVAAAAAGAFTGRSALVVGATSGIGRGIAVVLARSGFSVTAVGRSTKAGEELVQEMTATGGSNHRFLQCDASRLSNVYALADSLKEERDELDVLVMTHCIATTQGRTETPEGLDVKLALHYYSRMAFVDALLPALRKGRSPRVLSVLSGGVHSPYQAYKTDPELKLSYSIKNAADAAGFYNDLTLDTFSRQEENKGITFIHAAPGFVKTNWGTEMPFVLRMAIRGLQVFGRSVASCAEYMSLPLLKPSDGGFQVVGQYGSAANVTSLHDEARDTVWKDTQEILARFRK